MRNFFIYLPPLGLALLGLAIVQQLFPATWGPCEPSYQLIVDYRGTVAMLDHGLSQDECRLALPCSDRMKQVAFTCEREG
ncbi:hypothetical protein V474_22815 [Novosphingobium barchaimii LL02]|uniref:Uncharacterized protein n=1 Tax=Novosphingobium barchaimii LL02 TaxID=1114963 RepID=A0A0J8AFF3_9SPHN|nr:hypothetical protein [Novosphingobium barchaimii]KMS53615.1 hypothetical protein V474_22815 [Novosphingobium barchaimii LL02]